MVKINETTPTLIRAIEVKEVQVSRWDDMKFTAELAYLTERGLTCGKLTVHSGMCSAKTLELLSQFLTQLEKDAASKVFKIDAEDSEPIKTEQL